MADTEYSYPPRPNPDMRCGDCGQRLVYEPSRLNPDYGSYTHAGGMMDRHGAYPVEPWNDADEFELSRWESWSPPSWEYPPLPGVVINPQPPEPPVGTQLSYASDPSRWVWERTENGWRQSTWPPNAPGRWDMVLLNSGPLILFKRAEG